MTEEKKNDINFNTVYDVVYDTVSIHPENPRYFIYKGKPMVFITSTEHYGAVSNLSFDYEKYLDMLHSHGFNLTRLIVLLREDDGEFKGYLGHQNTLAASAEEYVAPWKRSDVPGCADGGNKFDLDSWNEEYFLRLKDFCRKADERGIIVEITFFSQFYTNNPDSPWRFSALNPANNINGIGAAGYNRITTLENENLTAIQESLVRKIVTEMKDFGNIYYEICNEPPYPEEGDPEQMPDDHPHVLGEKAISEWENYMAQVIINTESGFPRKHMIAVCDPHESIDFGKFSILNYHYMHLAFAGLNKHYHYNKPQVMDETLTGIVSWNREMDFDARRKEAWEFFFRGGSGYDYLDFTIATDDPEGVGKAEFPGGYRYDGTMMRRYLKYLKDFIFSLDFTRMAPDNSVIKNVSGTAKAFALAEKEKTYAVYINGCGLKNLLLELPAGSYTVEWFDPMMGCWDRTQKDVEGGGEVMPEIPLYYSDIALKLEKKQGQGGRK